MCYVGKFFLNGSPFNGGRYEESSKPLRIASALYSKAINGRPVIAVEETSVPQSQYSPHQL